jgi:hypothetical protein
MRKYYKYFHRILFRWYIKFYKNKNKEYYTHRSSLEPYLILLCKRLLKKDGISLLTYYIEDKFYILNNDILVIIKSDECEIVDGINHYNVSICPKTYNIIMTVFNGKLKQTRDMLEESYLKNVTNSLKVLCENI